MRLFFRDRPKIKESRKRAGFDGWIKCAGCPELIHANELAKNSYCCPKCSHHYRVPTEERIAMLLDEGSFQELFDDLLPADPLEFVDTESYLQRLERAQRQSQRKEAARVGRGVLEGSPVALGVLDFEFLAGSMGSVVGEKLTLLMEYALEHRLPLILVSASGGARMQESIFSLMQMAKTSAALAKLHEARIPYLSVLTHPTTGGVTASFASLGDVILAEPGALICFAGPRVVEQVIREKLPPGAQRAEFLLEHGMIDTIVRRHEMKRRLAEILKVLQ